MSADIISATVILPVISVKHICNVLRLFHCSLLFVRGEEEWVDEKTDGEKGERS